MDARSDDDRVGNVVLRLADATKAVETAPNDIVLGAIRLRAWQLHRLSPMPPDFPEQTAYLARVNYEFDIAPGVPPPVWAEVEFQFSNEVTVVDALPRSVYEPQDLRSYGVNQHLNFTSAGTWWPAGVVASDVALPPVRPRIDCFGPGSNQIRWRHAGSQHAEMPIGSHTAWLVLLTSPEPTVIPVVASGLYWLDLDSGLDLVPTSRREAFLVRFPDHAALTTELQAGTLARTGRPRVFISYSQEAGLPDGPAHKANVIRLWRLLEENGVDVLIDQSGLDGRRNWLDWTNVAIQRSDYTIVVASPAYRAASEDRLPSGQNPGVRSEYVRLADLLHYDERRWSRKILPVVLPGRKVEEIPLAFLPHIADHYMIEAFTSDGAADLLRVIHSRIGLDTKGDS